MTGADFGVDTNGATGAVLFCVGTTGDGAATGTYGTEDVLPTGGANNGCAGVGPLMFIADKAVGNKNVYHHITLGPNEL